MIDPYTITIWVLTIASLIAALYAIHLKDLLSAIIVMGMVDLTAALIFLFLHAPDVAITQASIGAGLTVVIFLYALKNTERWEA